MPNLVRVLTVPDADRAELERRARSKHRGFTFCTDPRLEAMARDVNKGQRNSVSAVTSAEREERAISAISPK